MLPLCSAPLIALLVAGEVEDCSVIDMIMLGDTSILHHAFISIFIALWVVITHYISILMGKLTGQNSAATRRNLGGINLGLWWSCSAGDTSLREGEIITNVITNDRLIGRGSISISIFTSTILSQTLHLLYPILYQNHKLVLVGD